MATIDLQDAEKWMGKFQEQFRAAALRGIHAAALRGVQVIQTQIIPARTPQPVDRAIYKAGWKAVQEADGSVIENLETHAVFIEHGVRAANVKIGMRMIRALTEWVVRKGIDLQGQTPQNVAWRIARSMQKRGIFRGGQGFGILKELIEKRIAELVSEEVSREVSRMVKGL